MSEEKVFSGNNVKEVAQGFAEIVRRNYLKHLEFWQATATDDREEYYQWQRRIETEPDVVKQKAFEKILQIMQAPASRENKKFYKKKWGFFRSKTLISITKSTGFYDDLLPEANVEPSVSVNVEYLIDVRYLIIMKKIYSQYTRL